MILASIMQIYVCKVKRGWELLCGEIEIRTFYMYMQVHQMSGKSNHFHFAIVHEYTA